LAIPLDASHLSQKFLGRQKGKVPIGVPVPFGNDIALATLFAFLNHAMGGQYTLTLVSSESHNLSDFRFLKRNGFDDQKLSLLDGGGHTCPYCQGTDHMALPQQIDEELSDGLGL
jgi:hypothetical protein